MKKKMGLFAATALALALSTNINAALIDRGNGMIYDDVQDITWLADANYAKSSGYDSDGRMTWHAANIWADNLVFGGFDDWRLVNTDQNDPSCSPNGYNCTGSELGHLYYIDLGLTQGQSILSSTDDDLNLFSNIPLYAVYWSSTENADDRSEAWFFNTNSGYQNSYGKNFSEYAWAVRSGDVSAAVVPVPGTLWLMAACLAGIAGTRRRHC